MERRYLVAALAIIATFATFSRGFQSLQQLSQQRGQHGQGRDWPAVRQHAFHCLPLGRQG